MNKFCFKVLQTFIRLLKPEVLFVECLPSVNLDWRYWCKCELQYWCLAIFIAQLVSVFSVIFGSLFLLTSHESKCLLTDWKETTAPCHPGLIMSSHFLCAYTICQNFTLHTLVSGLASQHYQYILVRDLPGTVCYPSHIIYLYLLF